MNEAIAEKKNKKNQVLCLRISTENVFCFCQIRVMLLERHKKF